MRSCKHGLHRSELQSTKTEKNPVFKKPRGKKEREKPLFLSLGEDANMSFCPS